MKNENENNGKSVEKMAEDLIEKEKMTEELIDKVIAQMEKSGATIDGLKCVIAAIERRKAQLNEANHEEDRKRDDVDERIKIVRRTLSSEVKNGIVIAMNEDKNGSPESVIFAKGDVRAVVSMETTALIYLLKKNDTSLEEYIEYLQLVVSFVRKEGGMK